MDHTTRPGPLLPTLLERVPLSFLATCRMSTGQGEGGGGDGGTGTPPPPQGGGSDKTFTQADLDRIVQERVAQTKTSTAAELQKTLGCTLDEAKEILAAHKTRTDAELSDAQKARRDADAEKATAAEAKVEAAKERRDARIERALVAKGVTDEKKLTRLSGMLVGQVDVEADMTKVRSAVDELQKEWPELFGGEAPPTPPNGDPKGGPPKGKKEGDAYSRGVERAKSIAPTVGYKLPGFENPHT